MRNINQDPLSTEMDPGGEATLTLSEFIIRAKVPIALISLGRNGLEVHILLDPLVLVGSSIAVFHLQSCGSKIDRHLLTR